MAVCHWLGYGSFYPVYEVGTTLDARGFLREEAINGDKRREKREKWENLWLPMTVDWSYCANRFELGSRSDPASWLEEPYSVLWLAVVLYWQVCCYWLPVNWSHDVDCHMIVRFTSPATRGFLSPLLSLFCRRKKTSGTGDRVYLRRVEQKLFLCSCRCHIRFYWNKFSKSEMRSKFSNDR